MKKRATSLSPCAAGKFAAILLAILTTGSSIRAEQQTVRVGVYQNQPKVFQTEQGEVAGFFIDLIEDVAKEEDWHLVFVYGTWTEGLDRLTQGQIDLMPDVSYSAEREKKWKFNRNPALSDWFQVLCLRDHPISSILDLANKRIAVLRESVQQKSLESIVRDFDLQAEIISMPDYDVGLKMLRQHEVDLMIANRYLAVNAESCYPEIEATPVIFNPTRLHFAAPIEGRDALLDAIDRHLVQWKNDQNSIYYTSLKRWTGETPKTVIPRFIKYAACILCGALLLAASIAVLLRWQVRKRTAELESALEQLRKTQEKAIQQERLHALGQMASGIAHDFNNILTPIVGLADILLLYPEKLSDHNLVKKNLEIISKAGRDGAEIVRRMRAFYQTHEPEPCRETDPCDAVEAVVDLARPRWTQVGNDGRHHIKIETRLTRGPHILVQETGLREALLNLVGNALDAMPKSGTITLSVRQEKQLVVISVSDTGTGMTPEIKKNCLAAFYTTKGCNGTGIGLAMVKDFCDKNRGRLSIDTQEGSGTTVSMTFPWHAAGLPAEQPKAGTPRRIRPLDILIVDDEPQTLQTMETILSQNDHRITAVSDPGEALKYACSQFYDLVITDRSMPGLSGDELAQSIRSLPGAPPVVIVTGTPVETAITQMEKVHVLFKPLDIRLLNQLLADIGFESP
ncbi:MAG: transporter substrate-binding domain-containing protein [Kiritimatiellales bacterium]|nr:transporter substrate-binding domain-containing protein [Kiritimatiellales bacterium]